MFASRLLTTAATLGGLGPGSSAAAHAAAPPAAVDAYTLTSGRLVGTLAALVALAGVIIGGWALVRSAGRVGHRSAGSRGGIGALGAGLAGLVVGGLVVAGADGGPGTGHGIVGGFAALAAGSIATVLGGIVLSRARRARRGG